MKRYHSGSSDLPICKLLLATKYPKRSPSFGFKPNIKILGRHKNLSYNLFRQIAFNNRDKDVRIKVWMLESNWGTKGRDGPNTDSIPEVSAS